GGIGLVVVVDEPDRPPEQTALGVHVLGPHLHREQRGPAVPAQRAGEAHAEPDFERLLRNRRERDGEGERRSDGRMPAIHAFLPATDQRGLSSWPAEPLGGLLLRASDASSARCQRRRPPPPGRRPGSAPWP